MRQLQKHKPPCWGRVNSAISAVMVGGESRTLATERYARLKLISLSTISTAWVELPVKTE